MRPWPAALVLVALALGPAEAWGFCHATTCNEAKQACAKDAKGCLVDGERVAWRATTLPYRMHDRGSRKLVRAETRAAIRMAFGTWSDVVCAGNARTSLRFVEQEDVAIDPLDTADPDDPTRKLNGVFFRDDVWPHARGVSSALAATFRVYGDRTSPGTVTSARIEVNTAQKTFALPDDGTEGTDLVAVLVHEVGHFIGIGHSREPESIMMDTYCEEGSRCTLGRRASRRLADDDVAAVCALFPPGEPTVAPAEGTGGADSPGCAASGARPSAAVGFGATLLVLAAAWRRRRASRG